jgi:Protein of unknown function (DUF3089)
MVTGTSAARRYRVSSGWTMILAAFLLVAEVAVPVGVGASDREIRTSSSTVWLCRPGQRPDPCNYPRAATTVAGSGATRVARSSPTRRSAQRFDCFYVYPTVSTEQTDNADLVVQPAELAAAASQASRFSQVCRVWAPMYRQATVYALSHGAITGANVSNIAYTSLLSGWRDYLRHDNDGRPIVFIGHSQGAAMLIRLLQTQIDPSPRLRKQLVSAIILGGNVQVPIGRRVGGSFRRIPTCASATSTGCVIAYSTFGSTPPPLALFGRPGRGVSIQSGQTTRIGQQVACVNPVTFSSGTGPLQPYFLAGGSKVPGVTVTTPWVSFPGLYTAQCRSATGATWLQVTATPTPNDPRPTVTDSLGPLWGYHLVDVNIALGNLVRDVTVEEAAYR